ncbi:hypothetical protein HPB48_008037 [Haemaphysalis longicornis]|uniref:Unconventional prefoldin RPB5 interactor n=1 Tax=Haemaphysalis longicornis TaxID=44386 RepID=A0A9J6G0Q4_HAELO|nr:hypothetical protein HPB48_008037 [Haemaphysalis longicornis]
MAMDPGQLEKLREAQIKGLQSCDAKLQRWAQYERDYEALSERLRTLPDRVSHEVMVPINSLAFMPGRIVHTNEVLVLLGDNWFAERSASQALAIAQRRADHCRQMTRSLNAEREQRTNWMKAAARTFASPTTPPRNVPGGKRHRKSVREYHKSKRDTTGEQRPDADVWELLDRLEVQERKSGETAAADTTSHEDASRRVRWRDESSGRISFSYTTSEAESSATSVSSSSEATLSPGDILRMFGGPEVSAAKSILKNTSSEVKPPILPKASLSPTRVQVRASKPAQNLDDPFTGNVVERRSTARSSTLDIDVNEIEIPAPLSRPKSLFRSRRSTKQ